MDRWFAVTGILIFLLTVAPRLATAAEGGMRAPVSAGAATGGPGDAASDPSEGAGEAAIGDETLLMDVRINGHSIDKIGEFVRRRGTLMARPSELRDLGLRIPDSLILRSHDLIALSGMRGLSWSLDEKNMVLSLTVDDSLLLPTLLDAYGQQTALNRRRIESGTGLTLNYDTVGTFSGGSAGGTGSADVRAFSRWGVASSDWLAYAGGSLSSGATTAVRLDSTYSFADVNSLRRYSLGDYITSGLAWTRPIRLEGVQVRSDFSMRPDLITFPMPTIKGSTAVPSTVDVLADGNLAASSQVGAGPFQIPQLPVVSGAGTISMTVTNALGQQVTTTQPFYASTELLAPGLQTFAVQSGLVRRNWGVVSNDYGKLAGTAMYRRGLTPTFTIEASTEGTPGTFLAGAGGAKQIGHLGVVNFAGASSSGGGHSGEQISAGAERIGRVFSLGGSAILATRDYRDVAALNGDGIPRKQLSAFTSVALRRLGSLGGAYAGIDRDSASKQGAPDFAAALHSHVLSANYSFQFHRATVYASEFKNISGTDSSGGLQVGITIPLGRRDTVNVSGTSDGNVQIQAQRSAALVGEWGYNGYISSGNSNHAFGQAQYKSHAGLISGGVDQSAGATSARVEAQGAVSLTDGALFPSNTIYDSFAVVDTSPVAHVHVLQENRDVGKTNSSGRLLVPDLRAFDLNHLAIAATDIPADVTIDTATREMRPQDRSGVVVKFPAKVSRAALLELVDEAGRPLELGSVATLQATGDVAPVGYDGDAYVADLSPHNELSVERKDGRRCTVSFDYKAVAGDIPSIGPLRCVEKRP